MQRGGTPTAHDRVLATRFGVTSVELVKNGDFGKMVALQGDKIVPVSLEEEVSKSKTVNTELYNIAKIFFGKGKVKDFTSHNDENKYSQVC